jgi:hypothetical protein
MKKCLRRSRKITIQMMMITTAIELAGACQNKVTVDDVIIVNKLLPLSKWKEGETLTLQGESEVLLLECPVVG